MISAVLDHLWQSTLVALAAGLLALMLRKARASVRYALWFAASAKFLVPFAALGALGLIRDRGKRWRPRPIPDLRSARADLRPG